MELFGIDLINVEDLVELVARLAFNLLVVVITVRYLYHNAEGRKEYFFTH